MKSENTVFSSGDNLMNLEIFQYSAMIRGLFSSIEYVRLLDPDSLYLEPDPGFNGTTFKNWFWIRSRIQNHNQYSVIKAPAPGGNLITAATAPQH
jgi:hypothetical protein